MKSSVQISRISMQHTCTCMYTGCSQYYGSLDVFTVLLDSVRRIRYNQAFVFDALYSDLSWDSQLL